MSIEQLFPVNAYTCTVLGHRYPPDCAAWTGLHFDSPRVELRHQATIMLWAIGGAAPYDLHLNVPWSHPSDDFDDEDCMYRVRPRFEAGRKWKGRLIEAVNIEWDGERSPPWVIRVRSARGIAAGGGDAFAAPCEAQEPGPQDAPHLTSPTN